MVAVLGGQMSKTSRFAPSSQALERLLFIFIFYFFIYFFPARLKIDPLVGS